MSIQWYPGHMTKAMRMIEENVKIVDVIFYVLDARAPMATINPHFNTSIGSLPIIYVINKADLVLGGEIRQWADVLSSATSRALAIDSTRSNSARTLLSLSRNLLKSKIEKKRARGIQYSARAMVLGVPNTGKSTLINNLCGSGRTQTGNKPGVTRGKQWLKADEYFDVLDTPGVLAPSISDERLARHLAYIGSIKDDILDIAEIATHLLAELNEIAPAAVLERYNRECASLEDVARSRGFLVKGGEVDIERAATALLDDFRKGRIGKIILEKAAEYGGE